MNIKEKFKRQGLGLEWGRNKVILTVGREKHKIVCSPRGFRWLKKAVDVLNDIGWVDMLLEGEMVNADEAEGKSENSRHEHSRERKRDSKSFREQIQAYDYNPCNELHLAFIGPVDRISDEQEYPYSDDD